MSDTLAAGIYNIPFDGPLHKKVVDEFKFRLKMSRDAQRISREKAWAEAEDTFLAYVPETELDAARKAKRKDGAPQYTTISLPYSYAMLLTAHTYYTSVFLSRTPVMQLTGRHGESQNAEQAIESLLDYQMTVGLGLGPLFIWLLDVGKYGYGVLGQYWDREVIQVSEYKETPKTFLGLPIPGAAGERKLITTEGVGYVGNRLYNVRPQDFYFDPRYPAYRFQDGEFCIVFDRVGWHKVARGAAYGRYFNVDKIPLRSRKASDRAMGSPRMELPGEDLSEGYNDSAGKRPATVDLHEFYWDVSPKTLGVGSSDKPEKWVFTIAGEEVCISAQPLGLLHGKFPFDVLSYEVEGYGIYSRSMLEVLDPTNKTLEWLLNSHFYNVRSALNNMFIGDPSRINTRDLESPEPGKFIRLKPAAYGQDVRSMLAQFPVQDITRSNLSDMEHMSDMAQRISGVSDNVMGLMNPGGRRTATEVRTSSSFSANRLKTTCEWFSAVGFAPLTQKLVQSTQQLYDIDRKFRIVGDLAQWGERYMNVTPADIQGFYDFVPVDGTLPVDRYAQANLWNQIMQTLPKLPQVMMQYDIAKMFGFVAQLAGIKNITQFRVQVQSDAMLQQQAARGNMVPVNAGKANSMEPGQVPGMGATG